MTQRTRSLGLFGVVLALTVAPGVLAAQEAAATPAAESVAAEATAGEAQAAPAAEAELSVEQLAARIQAVQRQALQDPVLGAANQEVSAAISAALPRVEPNYANYAARAQSLNADVAAAQAAGDNARLHELAEEARTLQANIAAAQAKAKEDPAVKEKLQAFTVQLFAKMVEIDPEVKELVEQLEARRAAGAAES